MNQPPATDNPKAAYLSPALRLPRFICGIDPDTDKSGVVIFDRDSRTFPVLLTLDMPRLQSLFVDYAPPDILIVVEAGWLNPGLFHGKDTRDWDARKAKAYGAAIGKTVGRNFEVGHSIIHFLTANQYQVEQYRPCSRKWNSEFFRRQTKLKKGYNAEIRDSVRAIWSHISHLI